jgi:DNA-binding GntR family transcriptional regulator|tara:strand:- start:923 stop:1096 length:174 start_codon:yes stop_codon:yes gene_type:complete
MSKAWDIVEGLISVAQVVVKAIRNGDEEKVDEILSEELKTTLAKARAEAEAYAKFGE